MTIEEQLQHAALDVEYLPALYDVVFSDLSKTVLLKYCQEDSVDVDRRSKETDGESLYRQFSLDGKKQIVKAVLSLL